MNNYSDPTIVDVDATVIGAPLPLVGLPEPPELEESGVDLLEPGVSHTLLRAVGISTLTGASLTLMTKPVFWMDAKYLYSPPIKAQPVSERFSSIDIAGVQFEPATIVVPSVATPRFTQAVGGSEAAVAAPALDETVPLSRPQGFRPPTAVKPGAINLPPVPPPEIAALSQLTIEQPAAEQLAPPVAEASPVGSPQLDLAAVLPTPPTVAYGGDAIAAQQPSISLDIDPVEPPESLPTETFAATLPPPAQTNGLDTTQLSDQSLPWIAKNPDASIFELEDAASRQVNTSSAPSLPQLPPVSPPLPFSDPLASEPPQSEADSSTLSLPEPSIDPTPTPPILPSVSVPSTSVSSVTTTSSELPPLPPPSSATRSSAPDIFSTLSEPSVPSSPVASEEAAVLEPSVAPNAPDLNHSSDPLTALVPNETTNILGQPTMPWLSPTEPDSTATEQSGSELKQELSPPATTEINPTNELTNIQDRSQTSLPVLPAITQDNPERLSSPVVQPQAIPSELPSAATSPEKITVSQFTITGNTVFDAEFLESVAWGAITPTNELESTDDASTTVATANRPAEPMMLSRADLVRASDAVTQYYIEEQYINSGAYVPEADWSDGAVEIR
ncbi:MAG: POTRA domain-containing protein, partial [Cyanobacteria bacterium J06642_11]